MQKTEYEDGTKTKEFFMTMLDALEDAKRKDQEKPIKKVTITMVKPKLFIPKKKKKMRVMIFQNPIVSFDNIKVKSVQRKRK